MWDSDENDADDLIGTGWVMLDEKEEKEPWRIDTWFPIRDRKGVTTGWLHMGYNPTRWP